MHIDFHGQVTEDKEIRAGFIGAGSHSFRNLYPVFQFAHINLVAVCDLDKEKAQAFADKFGAEDAYTDYKEMLKEKNLDAVFICTGYDKMGHPLYPKFAIDCLNAGVNVWIEKPPAASVAEIKEMQEVEKKSGKHVIVGFKKMFFPINEKAKELATAPEFGNISHVSMEYPQYIPTMEEFEESKKQRNDKVVSFLDHQCHPLSLLVYLLGSPLTLFYTRNRAGGGTVLFEFKDNVHASIQFTLGASIDGGMEFTKIFSDCGKRITINNNNKITYNQDAKKRQYGASPDYFTASLDEASRVWEPEFSLGQLYNKGIFLLGYYNEMQEMALSILENRKPLKSGLDQAAVITRVFEAFFEGPNKIIKL